MVSEIRIRNELNTDAAMVITNDGVKQIDFTKLYNDQLGSMETGRFKKSHSKISKNLFSGINYRVNHKRDINGVINEKPK